MDVDVAASSEPLGVRVASHYDELDPFYRDVWGEHLHHGLWRTGREDRHTAVRQLVDLVAEKGRVHGRRVCDVGCGYGATARILARDYRASVVALTLSARQFDYARRVDPGAGNPSYLLRDWLANDLPSASFDAVLAVECLSHMADGGRFAREAHRVLRPGGRLVVCAWLAGRPCGRWARTLRDRIERDGALAALRTAAECRTLLAEAGFEIEEAADLTRAVRRTWSISVARLLARVVRRHPYRRFLLDRRQAHRRFALAVPRLWLAYRTGAMAYGLFVARKPLAPTRRDRGSCAA